jgi:LacI family transcriptional regulator
VDAGYRVLVCANDLVAIAAYERLLQLGLRVPEDVGLTGYDAAPVRALISVDITTVELGVRELGREAARLLVEAILSRTAPRGQITCAGELHAGATL